MATNIPSPGPAVAPPKQGGNALKYVLIGCGSLLLIVVLLIGGVVFYGVHKAKQMGLDPGLMKRNPAFATAKIMASANPDTEIVSADEGSGTITVLDKKTGKKLTIDVNQTSKKGKIVFRGEGGEEMSIQTGEGAGGEGSIVMKNKEGTTTIGAGSAAKLPAWLPAYPGAAGEGKFAFQSESGGSFGFTTKDAPEKVADFYEQGLKGAGLTISKHTMPSGTMVMGEDSATKRNVMVNATSQNGQTQVAITYETKK